MKYPINRLGIIPLNYEDGGVDALQDRRGKSKRQKTMMSELERLRAEVKLLKAEKKRAEMEASFLKKPRRNREEAGLSRLRYTQIYLAIKEEHEEQGYPITELCKLGQVTRAAYYKWLNREIPVDELENPTNCRKNLKRSIRKVQIKDTVEYVMTLNGTMIYT